LAEKLLDACEIGAGPPSIEPAKTDLGGIVDDVMQAFADRAARVRTELLVSVRGPVVGCWDPIRLEQIVVNLIDNSIKFGAGKPVHVDVEARNGWARLSVRDEGPGFSGDDAKHAFDRYWRAKAARNIGGLGLGLYVAKEMAEAHGGTLSLESIQGKGSTFTLEQPLGDA